mmetsp:Transcript_20935/g.31164  ORF Transcript_20935/g.31164 Transcript_20935/m.31164 type:complete len:149 (+) Transcript_20935:726-1172(+)
MYSSILFSFSFLFFTLYLTCFVSADIWSNCGSSSDDFQVSNVLISPDPPIKGAPLNLVVNGTLSKTVTGGSVSAKLKYGFITIVDKTEPICELQKGVCPIASGVYGTNQTVVVPDAIPNGKYIAHVEATDQDANQILCVDINVKFSSN